MKYAQSDRVRLGSYELDLRSGELLGGEQKMLLQEQPLQVLRMLVEREGELVSREEIQKRLWLNDTIVEFDHSINAAIKNLRRALGDSATEPKYIETLARRGYRLMVPVERVASDDSSVELPAMNINNEGAAVAAAPQPRVRFHPRFPTLTPRSSRVARASLTATRSFGSSPKVGWARSTRLTTSS